ncbi:enoyl-CoA hydratase-related protein [Chloroflexota bacterium]
MADKVLFEKKGRTAIVTINRPEAMNAYDTETMQLIAAYGSRIMHDPDLWTVIVTGAGDKAFSAGSDMKQVNTEYVEGRTLFGYFNPLESQSGHLWRYPPTVNKPIICAINGYCVGGGLEIALRTDIRIAAENAIFEVSEPKRGMIPGTTPAMFPRVVPHNIALELMLTCRRFDAQEAYRIGFVNKVVPLAELMPAALAMADEINANAPLAIRAEKTIAYNGMSLPLSEALAQGSRMLREVILPTEDSKEGTRAFVEKRKPVWKAR